MNWISSYYTMNKKIIYNWGRISITQKDWHWNNFLILKYKQNSVWAIIINKDWEILLQNEYRIPLMKTIINISWWWMNWQSRQNSLKNELIEELWIYPNNFKYLWFIYNDASKSKQKMFLYLVTDFSYIKRRYEENEIISYKFVKIDTLEKMIKKWEINDAKFLAAYLLYKTKYYKWK